MITGIPYLIEVQICFALFWAIFYAVIGRGRDFAVSRAYLLIIPVLSVVFPLLNIPVFIKHVYTAYAAQAESVEFFPADELADGGMDLASIIVSAMIAGTLFFLIRFLISLIAIKRMSHRAEKVDYHGISLYDSERCRSACSFFKRIYINRRQMGDRYLEQIITHEMAHIDLRHSHDRVYANIIHLLFWWNPAVWLWRRSLVEVHEYQADRRVLNKGYEKAQYINLIIKELADMHPELVSGFSYSLIKKRLIMISKRTSGRFAKLRILAAVPIMCIVFLLFSCKTRTVAVDTVESGNSQVQTVAADEQPQDLVNVSVKDEIAVIPEKVNLVRVSDSRRMIMLQLKEEKENGDKIFKSPDDGEEFLLSEGKLKSLTSGVIYTFENPQDKVTTQAVAQTEPKKVVATRDLQEAWVDHSPPEVDKRNIPVLRAEKMPKFEGGDLNTFRDWVQKNVEYPEEVQKAGIQGTVTLAFVVDVEGNVTNVEVLSSPDKMLSDSAVKVVASSPKWTPGVQSGGPQAVKMTIPVQFVLK